MPIDVHAHYVPPQLIAAIKSRRQRHRRPPHPRRRRQGGARLRLRLQGAAVLPAPGRARAERHKWMDEQKIDHQIVGTWPDIFGYGLPHDALHRLASHAQRHAGGMDRGQRRHASPGSRRCRSPTPKPPRPSSSAPPSRRDRRHHLLQHREREPRRIPARSVLAQGRGARPAHPDPSGERRARPAHPEIRARPDRALHLRHHARHRLAADVRRDGPLPEAEAALVARRRRLALSRRPLRRHAQAHGQGARRATSRRKRRRPTPARCTTTASSTRPRRCAS